MGPADQKLFWPNFCLHRGVRNTDQLSYHIHSRRYTLLYGISFELPLLSPDLPSELCCPVSRSTQRTAALTQYRTLTQLTSARSARLHLLPRSPRLGHSKNSSSFTVFPTASNDVTMDESGDSFVVPKNFFDA
jgi:hypothetical protein